ncbi:MAG: hypothetical protein IKO10_02555 [Lachnospiraceae bacterium]|nr:hypothetical protein [Lachnospiraceae bacterium]
MKNKIAKIVTTLAVVIGVGFSGLATVEAGEDNYTYTYDYWGDVQESPDVYSVAKVYTYKDLGLSQNISNAESLFVAGDNVYICDTGNNRIVVLQRKGADDFEVVREISQIKGADINTLSEPADVAVSDDGYIYIADRGNARILKVDMDLNYVLQFNKPVDLALTEDSVFKPDKIVIDTAGRVYCSAKGINKGLVKYENDGTFSGFVGATRVAYNFTDYLWKKFASQEQRAKMESFVPTEYDNVYMDSEGFIYACAGGMEEEDLKAGTVDAVRKLNMLGSDILVRNGAYYDGDFPVYGDLYWGGGGGISGPSYFKDVTVLDNDLYVCLDQNRGRLFGYDDQGRMVYAFGGSGNMDGYFRKPVSIEHMDKDLLVLDQLDCSITLFIPTEYGSLIYTAMDQFEHGEYDAAQASWEQVKMLNGNYSLAYIGIGRSLLRKGEYKEAMPYFEAKYDDENYSRAFQQYRKQWIRENLIGIVVIILALFLVPMGIGRVYQIKEEIDNADIFKLRRK